MTGKANIEGAHTGVFGGNGEMPPGDHPLEVAAREGLGPLSPSGAGVWHGQCEPCVSCGLLVPRGAEECHHCGQELSPSMRAKMKEAAGPWIVYEHVRPFPGISFERLLRQVRKGVITATSIVRGPTTDFQWRFAGETPGLSKHLGMCWSCSEPVQPTDAYCPACLSHLDGAPQAAALTDSAILRSQHLPPDGAARRAGGRTSADAAVSAHLVDRSPQVRRRESPAFFPPDAPMRGVTPEMITEELRALTAVLEESQALAGADPVDEPARIAGVRVTWVIVAMLILVAAVFLGVIRSRSDRRTTEPATLPAAAADMAPPSDAPSGDATTPMTLPDTGTDVLTSEKPVTPAPSAGNAEPEPLDEIDSASPDRAPPP
ncbi:MAG: zinc ribbon domain-containing protein [Phycisphaerae bacterium]|nr:MAG: hypothetical protein EDS66_12885 [Planctomycetota bacterium]KAB2945308.1 MAG: hypothetical protein F9K17_10075 [Phycisphaerae bacterium]MBE7458879.1 zinc ribbon domain-containing protein [Planctomycetia bacterium]MCK6466135.1 zinc ribbon domain-containing protein [Phycisphaerae bacterium]MCL4720078.1 zinc ribbon domain-containing protein [Phycisphaerae bacterium]